MCCVSSGAPHRALSRTLWIRCTGGRGGSSDVESQYQDLRRILGYGCIVRPPVTGVVKSFVEDIRRINAGEMRDGFEDGWRALLAESRRRYFAPLVSMAREIKACSINLGRAVAGTSSIDDK